MYAPATLVTVAILTTLAVFRLIDDRAPWRVLSFAALRFPAETAPRRPTFSGCSASRDLVLRDMSYRLLEGGKVFEYGVHLEGARDGAFGQLAERLRTLPGLIEFELSRVGNRAGA